MDEIFFWYSLIFLVIRTFFFLIIAANINDESKNPLLILRAAPRQAWSKEIERFIEEIIYRTIALSGFRFFYLTRRLILSVSNQVIVQIKIK